MSEVIPNNSSEDQSQSLHGVDLESMHEVFESAWMKIPYPDLQTYISTHCVQADSESRTTVTVQLIRIDLAHRWKSDGDAPVGDLLPTRPHVNDYVTTLTEFSDIEEVPIELLAFEFRVEHLWDDGPHIKDFTGQFMPKQRTALQNACKKVTSNISMQASPNFPHDQNAGADGAIPTSKMGGDLTKRVAI